MTNPFKYIVANSHDRGRTQRLFRFPNGFGASVVKHSGSYGGAHGLYELAVTAWTSEGSWSLEYGTPITSDVLGWLTEAEVFNTLVKIHDLPIILDSDDRW
jgi:hypothetical protein